MNRVSIATLSLFAAMSGAALAADYKVVKTFKMPDGTWDYATSDLGKNLVYWVRGDHTDVIDAKTGNVTSLKGTGNGHMAVVVPGTSTVVIPMRDPAKTNRIYDAAADTIIADVAGGAGPDGATYDAFSKHVFVMNHGGGDATEIDPVAKTVVATVQVYEGKLEFPTSDGAGHVFVNMQDAGKIGVIDVKEHKTIAQYDLAGCKGPSGLAYAPKIKALVASCANNVAKVIDAASGKELASIDIGAGPDAVIYEPRNSVMFIPCGVSGELAVISVADVAAIKKVQTVKLPVMARTGAIDADGRLYMMAAEPDPTKPLAGGGRPTPKEGSYEMVVVGQ